MTLNNKAKIWKPLISKWRELGVDLSIFGSDTQANIYILEVPEGMRGQGIATKVMKEVVNLSDYHNITLTLTPSDEFGSDYNRLKDFYSKFGFISLGSIMIRRPDISKVWAG